MKKIFNEKEMTLFNLTARPFIIYTILVGIIVIIGVKFRNMENVEANVWTTSMILNFIVSYLNLSILEIQGLNKNEKPNIVDDKNKSASGNNEKLKVITLCGSTKLKTEFEKVAKRLSLEGNVVLMPSIFSHANNEEVSDDIMELLIEEHVQKMRMSDEIRVISYKGKIGTHTAKEIEYAYSIGIPVLFEYVGGSEDNDTAETTCKYFEKKLVMSSIHDSILSPIINGLHDLSKQSESDDCKEKSSNKNYRKDS